MSVTADLVLDRIAARQYGLVTRAQVRACGLTDRQIVRRLAQGRWIQVAAGVYRLAGAPTTWHQRAFAACLAGPPGSVASRLTAAALHGLSTPPSMPQIVVPRGTSPRVPFATVRWADLGPHDRLLVDGIPCTSVARTLLDCAGVLDDARSSALVDTAFCAGKSHPTDVVRAIDRAQAGRGKKGVARLRRSIEAWSPGIAPGSPAEMRLLRQIRSWGFDAPESQLELRTAAGELVGRIDLGWPERRLGLEYDGVETHNPRHWARDEARHPRYAALGWDVHRVDKYDLVPGAARLRELLNAYLARSAGLISFGGQWKEVAS
jgi:hypothetical protein